MIVLRVSARVTKQPPANKDPANVIEQQAQSYGDALGPGQGHDHAAAVHEQQGLEGTALHASPAAVISVAPDVTCREDTPGASQPRERFSIHPLAPSQPERKKDEK